MCFSIFIISFQCFPCYNVMYTVLPAMNQPKGNINFQKKKYITGSYIILIVIC